MYSDAILTSTDTLKNETMGLDKKASTIANSKMCIRDRDYRLYKDNYKE